MSELSEIWHISDLVGEILSSISDGTTYKEARLVSRGWYVSAGDRIEEFINIPFTLWTYQHKLGIDIDVRDILSNPNTSLADIEELYNMGLLSKRLHDAISKNPNLTWDFIQSHPQINWDYYILAKHPIITWEIVNAHGFIAQSKGYYHPDILDTLEEWEVKQYKKENKMRAKGCIEWYMKRLLQNPNIPLYKLEEQYQRKFADYFEYIFTNPQITLARVEEYLKNGVSVNFRKLSRNPNLTQEFIEKYIGENWNWAALTVHPVITVEFIIQHKNIIWEYWELSKNPSIPKNWMNLPELQNRSIFINYIKPCMSPNYTMTDILIESNIDYTLLSQNPNLTWKFIMDHKECDWDWTELSRNKFRKAVPSIYNYNYNYSS